ncbi:hypothetical protein [Acidithiobacillus ferrivorans]|uniref:Uncharacterized protein n=1 Tax=Acidithiobacillus ferrivorans TaxID=160808 RepID=A0A060UV38_9PROT|nr:hypothetical protein [Acidithiobacillus ferrivorans]CDQ10424.1 hypothetical protein AFERRI_400205 [Acidithiobacillus ferrivorans]
MAQSKGVPVRSNVGTNPVAVSLNNAVNTNQPYDGYSQGKTLMNLASPVAAPRIDPLLLSTHTKPVMR